MSTSPSSPPRRPRLSLQIRAIAHGPTGKTSRTLAAAVDVKSPTSFNTLSNVYATAVDRSTPVRDQPPPNVLSQGRPSLRLQTSSGSTTPGAALQLQTPHSGPYLETPLTAQPGSPLVTAPPGKGVQFPSSLTMMETPPLSAVEQQKGARTLAFDTVHTPLTPGTRRRTTMPTTLTQLPYTHPRNLQSILRNSPLPPLNTKTPTSPRRQSLRLQEKAARRVAYLSPLCQTITTSLYTRSHVDLLDEDTPTTPSLDDDVLDQTMAYTGNETRDGGQTPGPFEEMRRRMAGLHASTPVATTPTSATSAGGIRKRSGKKKEKKRRWVWTIGTQEGEDEDGSPVLVVTPAPVAPPSATAAGTNKKTPTLVPVPVIALPAPRPRTRTQMAKMSSASDTPAAIPTLAIPAPRKKPTLAIPAPRTKPGARGPVLITPANRPLARAAPEGTPDPVTARMCSPEPVTAILASNAEPPPTPSLSVSSSTADPVFEADVEMSDASSVWSETTTGEETIYEKLEAEEALVEQAGDMDVDTPVGGTREVMFQDANRGWASMVS
ncbi:hypothetical protein QBC39DRAFT_347950 [Podospora conica]|nr:hypothetical protein QBC39DRAFT_347950 [Schizothecium conicum]